MRHYRGYQIITLADGFSVWRHKRFVGNAASLVAAKRLVDADLGD